MDDRFLSLAVELNHIDPGVMSQALQYLEDCRARQERPSRVGEWLIANRFIHREARDELLEVQKARRRARSRSTLVPLPSPTDYGIELTIALAAVIVLTVLVEMFDWELYHAAEVAGFGAFVLTAGAKYFRHRSIPLAVFGSAKWVLLTLALAVAGYGLLALQSLHGVLERFAQPTPSTHQVFVDALSRVRVALAGLIALVLGLAFYAAWKFQALRYSESRLGALKDLLIRIELEFLSGTDPTATVDQAITHAINGLRGALALAPGQRLTRLGRSLLGQNYGRTRIILAKADESKQRFDITHFAFGPDAPQRVQDACRFLSENHHPAFLNEDGFERLKTMAMGQDASGWKQRYLNFPPEGRAGVISACGWIHARNVTLFSRKASACLAWDRGHIAELQSKRFEDIQDWFEVGSFVGCPIEGDNGRPAGVLLAVNTRAGGVRPQDAELVLAVARILALVQRVGGRT